MPSVLDTILLKDLVTSPTTVNTNYTSDVIDVTFREDEFSIQLDYDSGVTVNMELSLEVSADGVTFVPIGDSVQIITDDTGTHIWDLSGTGTSYVRVAITVTTGSIDLQKLIYRAKRRH
jgi:hypothetical protein